MRTLRLLAVAAASMSPSFPLHAGPRPVVSWGKAGVSFAQYRWDSVACGKAGASRDMRGEKAFGEVMHGLQVQNSAIDRPASQGSADDAGKLTTPDGIDRLRDYSLTQHRTMQQQVPALQRFLVGRVERCLIGKGYNAFVLTRDQSKAFGKLAPGSQSRFEYLHRLASDPAIISAQAATAAR